MHNHDNTFQQIREALNNFEAFPYESPYFPEPTPSAVLVVLHLIGDQWHVLLTKRSENLTSHPGQISFPGGRVEPSDENLMATATREASEEVGLSESLVEVFAELTPVTTLTGYTIHPYVAVIEDLPELTLQAAEVDSAFHVPLSWLINDDNISIVEKNINGLDIKTFRLDWGTHIIWGATAMMIAEMAHRLKDLNS